MQDTDSFLLLFFCLTEARGSQSHLAAVQALNNDALCHKAELPTEKLFCFSYMSVLNIPLMSDF